jgi:hypothetical protein
VEIDPEALITSTTTDAAANGLDQASFIFSGIRGMEHITDEERQILVYYPVRFQ